MDFLEVSFFCFSTFGKHDWHALGPILALGKGDKTLLYWFNS